jgi:hypothetical protein
MDILEMLVSAITSLSLSSFIPKPCLGLSVWWGISIVLATAEKGQGQFEAICRQNRGFAADAIHQHPNWLLYQPKRDVWP